MTLMLKFTSAFTHLIDMGLIHYDFHREFTFNNHNNTLSTSYFDKIINIEIRKK